jgi:FkbM family methyltransferase
MRLANILRHPRRRRSGPIEKAYKNGLVLELVDYYPALRDNGWYEHSEIESQDWCIDNVGDDWTILDCGAHIGYYSLLFASLATHGRVFAFEASAKTADMFERNVAHNRDRLGELGTIDLIPAALGATVGENVVETLYFSGLPTDNGRTEQAFDFTTVDAFVAARGLDRVDLIKTDVDGWDYDVLLGARATIERFRPTILSEVNYALEWRGRTPDDVARLVEELEYDHVVLDDPSPTNWLMFPRR